MWVRKHQPDTPLVVCVTGAAGQIAYSLLWPLASGAVFGPSQVRHAPLVSARNGTLLSLTRCWARVCPGVRGRHTQPIKLHLLDIEVAMEALGGVRMELEDAALPLLTGAASPARTALYSVLLTRVACAHPC
jgi:malate/lactate dehydrogenase